MRTTFPRLSSKTFTAISTDNVFCYLLLKLNEAIY
jgi:hypothetical protein